MKSKILAAFAVAVALLSFTRTTALATAWSELTPDPAPRGYIAVATSGTNLYVIGGMAGACGYNYSCIDVQAYSTGANTWTTEASLPSGLTSTAAAAIGGTVYVAGGFGPTSTCSLGYCNFTLRIQHREQYMDDRSPDADRSRSGSCGRNRQHAVRGWRLRQSGL